jgi:hypothetical protein
LIGGEATLARVDVVEERQEALASFLVILASALEPFGSFEDGGLVAHSRFSTYAFCAWVAELFHVR